MNYYVNNIYIYQHEAMSFPMQLVLASALIGPRWFNNETTEICNVQATLSIEQYYDNKE